MKKRWMEKATALLLALILMAGSAMAASEEPVSQKLSTFYSLAVGYIGCEEYDKAMEYLDAALKICKEKTNGDMYADLHLKKACVYTIRKEYSKALSELKESLRVRPDVAETYLVRVQVYSETKETAKAAADLEQYIKLSGDTAMNDTLAQLYLQLEDRKKAEDSYRSLVEASTEDPELVAYNLAIYEMNVQMYEEALANLQTCAGDSGKYPALHYNSGICHMMLSNWAEAEAAFTASLAGEAYTRDATYNRAVCRMSQQQYEPAIEDFTAYIDGPKAEAPAEEPAEPAEEPAGEPTEETDGEPAEEPDAEPAEETEKQAEEYVVQAEEEDKEEAAAEQPASVEADYAYCYRGVCYIAVEKFAEATADFTVCIDGGLNVNESTLNRALSRLQSGEYTGAIEDFTACVEQEYQADDALFYRSYAYRYLGNNEAAIADLTACIEHGYNPGETYQQRAQVYQAMGDEANYLKDLEASLDYLED